MSNTVLSFSSSSSTTPTSTKRELDRGLFVSGTPLIRHAKGTTKMPPFVEASMRGDLSIVKEMLNFNDPTFSPNELDEEHMSALHWACAYGEAHIVQLLLSDPRVNPLIKNKRGGTPLHQSVLGGTYDVMDVLLKNSTIKSNIDMSNVWGETALILAATRGDSNAALILLENGANPHTQDNWGKNALEVAADHGEKTTLNVIQNFIDGKKDLIQKPTPSPHLTPLPSKVKSNRVLSKLFEAPLNEEQALKWIEEPDMDINGSDYYKLSALHKCAAWEKPIVLEALLKKENIQPNIKGQDGDTALHSAASCCAIRCVEVLIKDGRIDVNQINDKGITALMLSATTGNLHLVNIIANFANLEIKTPEGKTAWNFAKENQCEEIASFLWEKMSEVVRAESEKLYVPPKPKPARVGKKLAPQLIKIQEDVQKPKNTEN